MPEVPRIKLRDGMKMPQIGFGIWKVAAEITAKTVAGAFEAGYRLIDGAYAYQNEAGLGEGFQASGLSRDEVFITTKVWNHEHGRGASRASVQRSLDTIGIDQLDLVLIHWPVPNQDLYLETWEEFIRMRDDGLTRSIGVANFHPHHLERIISATGEAPAVNQIELHPELQQAELRKVNASHGITTQSWTPLGQGRTFDAQQVQKVASRTGKTPAQVVLRWNLQLGNSVIPRSIKPERQIENLDILDFELTAEEMVAMQALENGHRTGPNPDEFDRR